MLHDITTEDIERFWSKVDRTTGFDQCWPFIGDHVESGYGAFAIYHDGKRRRQSASRMAYELVFEELPKSLFACHHCDNPPCCNPGHLFKGTTRDNAIDMASKGRQIFQKFPERAAAGIKNGRHTHPEKTARGGKNGNSVLTDENIVRIRQLRIAGETQQGIAKIMGCGRNTVRNILAGRTWKHVP